MKSHLSIICAALLIVSASHSVSAQDSSATVARLALHYLAQNSLRAPLTVDPRVLVSPPPTAANAAVHPALILASLVVDSMVSVATLERAVACNIVSIKECKTNGQAAFAWFSTPAFTRDSATLRVFVRGARDLPAADSARIRELHIKREAEMRAPGYTGSALNMYDSTRTFERMSRGGATSYLVVLLRSGGMWRVISARIVGQS